MEREPGERTRDREGKAWKEKRLVFCLPGTGRRTDAGWSSVPGGHRGDPTEVLPAVRVRCRRGAWRWEPRPPGAAAAADPGAQGWGAGCGASVRALELLPEKAAGVASGRGEV